MGIELQRETILTALRQRRSAIEREGAVAMFIYGSRARGDHRADSDLDIFVDYDANRKFSLLDLAGIKLVVDDAVGLDTHVTTRDSLHPRLRAKIEQQAVRVF